MKNVKVAILVCGAVLLGFYISDGLEFAENPADTVIFLIAYGLPVLMGLWGTFKPPAQAWQGAVALSGFGVVAIRGQIWRQIGAIGEQSTKGKVAVALVIVGLIASSLAMLKPEDQA